MLERIIDELQRMQGLSGMERKRRAADIIKAADPREVLADWIERGAPQKNSLSFNPNGFYKIRLGSVGNTQLRLHVHDPNRQPPEGARVQEDAHDHRWSLYSRTVTGVIAHTTLGIAKGDSGELLHRYSYGPRGGDSYFTMQYNGEQYLREVSYREAGEGIVTAMDAHVIHRAHYPTQEITATFLITDEDRGRSDNFIFATPEVHEKIQQTQGTTPSPEFSFGEAVELMNIVLDKMDGR